MFRVLAVAWGVLLLFLHVGAAIVLARHGPAQAVYGWSWAAPGRAVLVAAVDPDGPAAGLLERGDRIVAIDGDPRVTRRTMPHLMEPAVRRGEVALRVERGGAERDVVLPIAVDRSAGLAVEPVAWLLNGLGFAVVGLALSLLDARHGGRLLILACLTTSPFFLKWSIAALGPWFSPWEQRLHDVLQIGHPLQFAFGYHFYARFPPAVPRSRFFSALVPLHYAVAVPAALMWQPIVWVMSIESLHAWRDAVGVHLAAVRWLAVLSPVAICAVIVRNYRAVQDPGDRRRVRLVMVASLVGVAPWTLSQLRVPYPHALGEWVASLNVLTVLIPVAAAYAVVVHRVFGLRVVVRRTLRYLLARHVLRAMVVLPVGLLAVRIVLNPHLTVGDAFFGEPGWAVMALVAAAGLRYRGALQDWLDRRFFRETHGRERLLLDLVHHVSECRSVDDLGRRVAEQVDVALHPKTLRVYLRRGAGPLVLVSSSTGASDASTDVPEELVHLLDTQSGQLDLSATHLPPDVAAFVAASEATLVVPIVSSEAGVQGFLVLGERRSEEPYSAEDRRLLDAVARQVAMIADNLRLRERMSEERRIRQDVLSRLPPGTDLLLECPQCGACADTAGPCAECRTEVLPSLPVPRLLDGRYRLDRLLGRGGMGAVYAALDERLRRDVAVKLLAGRHLTSVTALRRFEREARTAGRLSHPNIVAVHDYGTIEPAGAFIVMEHVLGRSLRRALRERGRVDPATAATWLAQIMAGVQAAHDAGLVHRDLKPENVLVTAREDGEPLLKLTDFGLVHEWTGDDEETRLTQAGGAVGTLAYMAPEQLAGGDPDPRADVYALAVMAVELLMGSDAVLSRTGVQRATGDWSALRVEGPPGASRTVEQALARALSPDPRRRPATVAELQQSLLAPIRALGA